MFQSPRSGKFESNQIYIKLIHKIEIGGFNPLDRGNLNQMMRNTSRLVMCEIGFNPLDRGNLNQIFRKEASRLTPSRLVSIP